MALLTFNGISLKQHINSGDEFLIGEITDWGQSFGTPVIVATFSDQPHSLKSLAIGPDSDIDQVNVRYALPSVIGTSQGQSGGKNVGQSFATERMSITAPYNSAVRDGYNTALGVLLALTPVDRFSDFYLAEGQAVAQPFGSTMNLPNIRPVWVRQPTLQVVLSGANTRLPATWGRRNNKFEHYENFAWFDAMGLNNEGVYKVWPIHGRKKVTVVCRSRGNGTFRVRLATVASHPSASDHPIESQVAPGGYPATTPIPVTAQAKFDITLASRATYLIVYATRTGPAQPGPPGVDTLDLEFSARDD